MCRIETLVYKCGHSTAVETQCQLYIVSGVRRCKLSAPDTGFEIRDDTDCPACVKAKAKFVSKPPNPPGVLVPNTIDFRKIPEDPNCGNPKTSEESKARCDAM